MKKNKTEILTYINELKGVQGYIQMSDKPISDIWQNSSDITNFKPQSGFVYEAHFWNDAEKKSISIKQINSDWLVNEVEDVPLTDTQTYRAINNLKVRMAQIWKSENDPLCDNGIDKKGLPALKLKKVVFAGFENGGKQ